MPRYCPQSESSFATHNYPTTTNTTNMEFVLQGGLSAILGPNPEPSQVHDLTLRAQCFYLSRKKSVPIDFDGYKAYLSAKQDENLSKLTSKSPSLSTISTQALSSGDDRPPPPPPHSISSHHEADLPSDQKTAPYPHTCSISPSKFESSCISSPGVEEPTACIAEYRLGS